MTPKEHFDHFKGHWFDASFLDDGLDGAAVWDNPRGVRSRDIDWLAFLSEIPLPEALCEGIALEMERIDPPLMLALSVWLAIREAVSSVAGHRFSPLLDAPATPERILAAVQEMRARSAGS